MLSSTSNGGDTNPAVPYIYRVSGCVDEADRSAECPVAGTVVMTMYGRNFQRTALSITVVYPDYLAPCDTIRVSTDERLRCEFHVLGNLKDRRDMLDVFVNSSIGTSTFPKSVGVTAHAIPPSISSVSGCIDDGAQTRDCTMSSEVRLIGAHFPRWLLPSIILAGQLELPCQWKNEERAVCCSLDDNRIDELPKGHLLPVQIRFAPDRISQPISALALRLPPPPPPPSQPTSSTGQSDSTGGAEGRDELEPIKMTFFIVCVLALVAIVGGMVLWMVGLWSAHRRAFVSANGQAAVDMRQVILH